MCLRAFVPVARQMVGVDAHMPQKKKPPIHKSATTSSSSSGLSGLHKRPHATSDPTGIHSDWGRSARHGPAGTMLSGQRGEKGGRGDIPDLPASLSFTLSFRPSLHANPEVERCHNKPARNGGEGIGVTGGHGSGTIQPLMKKENFPEWSSDCV